MDMSLGDLAGVVSVAAKTLSVSYVDGAGTVGVDNTAQTVKSIVIAANTLTKVGDRLRIRALYKPDTGTALAMLMTMNAVSIAGVATGTGAAYEVVEVTLDYIDATHANIVAIVNNAIDATRTALNVAGFNWAAAQTLLISQDQIANNHLIVASLIADAIIKSA
jgi:hypothetical protein